jgi:sensor domain CHASE-containing protein
MMMWRRLRDAREMKLQRMIRLAGRIIDRQLRDQVRGTEEIIRLRNVLERDLEVFEANDFRTDARRVRRALEGGR